MAQDQPTSHFFVDTLEIKSLWGQRDIELSFRPDVNIIIGPNGSGKTTVLNLLRHVLTADISRLRGIAFESVTVRLRATKGSRRRVVSVQSDEDGYRFAIGNDIVRLDFDEAHLQRFRSIRSQSSLSEWHSFKKRLQRSVPIVWLPVARRLPISERDQEPIDRGRRSHLSEARLESVDVRLGELLSDLKNYRLGLEGRVATQYKEFERNVLDAILYSENVDGKASFSATPPTEEERNQLLRAFDVAGLLDARMRRRIDTHFEMASSALEKLQGGLDEKGTVQIHDFFVIPLLGRTRILVTAAQHLETEREQLFAPLNRFEEVANSFLEAKRISVDATGELAVTTSSESQATLNPTHLSSGEKQILILLIQALLWEARPVVYLADEPELSLHVTWQEKLLEALVGLGGHIQVIVATHSPDIIGKFVENVILLEYD